MGNVMEAVAPIQALLDEYNQINEAYGEPDADFDKLANRQAELDDKINALARGNSTSRSSGPCTS